MWFIPEKRGHIEAVLQIQIHKAILCLAFAYVLLNINKAVLDKSYNSYQLTLIILPFVFVNIGFGFLVLPLLQENWSIFNRNKQTCEVLESRNSV